MRARAWLNGAIGLAGVGAAVTGCYLPILGDRTQHWIILAGALVAVVMLIAFCTFLDRAQRPTARAAASSAGVGQAAAWANGWAEGRTLAWRLAHGQLPPAMQQWYVVLRPGEIAYLDVSVFYSRYGTPRRSTLPRSRTRLYYFGGTGYASAGLLVNAAADAIGEAVEYRRAIEATTPQWRLGQHTRAILTDERIVVHSNDQWVSMDIDAVTEFYPDLARGVLEVRFDDAMPMRLQGASVPVIATWLGWALYGPEGLRQHPGLRQLVS
jgi:hypothetical protein